MKYSDLVKSGADSTEKRSYLADGETVAVAFRIPKNLRAAAKEEAELRGMSFSAFARNCMIQELAKVEKED